MIDLRLGDCLEVLKTIPENSIDSIVTDPPAGISFMGKSWDTDKGGRDNWIKWMCDVATECKRVLKPGGHAFVWAIPRTSHWTATAWENAGFEIRDVVAHIFGSGFPKSLNIGKAVDKLQGNERKSEIVKGKIFTGSNNNINGESGEYLVTKGTSEWEGWGTALKPAREDWILMRKPLEKGLNVAENCLKYGTGGINIDESRVETEDNLNGGTYSKGDRRKVGGEWGEHSGFTRGNTGQFVQPSGRFPANLIHDGSDEVVGLFPGNRKGGGGHKRKYSPYGGNSFNKSNTQADEGDGYPDSGSAARFFYCAKASKSERNKGLDGFEPKPQSPLNKMGGETNTMKTGSGNPRATLYINNHPTVKPIALMEYLIKMVTPKGGIVLDPFMGSGTTGIACRKLNYGFIGIELEPDYITIAKARIDSIKTVQEKLL